MALPHIRTTGSALGIYTRITEMNRDCLSIYRPTLSVEIKISTFSELLLIIPIRLDSKADWLQGKICSMKASDIVKDKIITPTNQSDGCKQVWTIINILSNTNEKKIQMKLHFHVQFVINNKSLLTSRQIWFTFKCNRIVPYC